MFITAAVCYCGPVVQLIVSEAERQGPVVRILRSLLFFVVVVYFIFVSISFHLFRIIIIIFSLFIFNYDFPSSC